MTNTNEESEVTQKGDVVDVFKKWRQSPKGGDGGFINFQYWPTFHKVIIDIGTVSNGTLKDNAKCFVNASQFLAYLKADVEGNVLNIFPSFFSETAQQAGWTTYGGSQVNGQYISRIFKVTYWPGEQISRDFKCAWFEGQPQGQGAIKPIFDKPLKNEHIKVSAFELAELHQNMTLVVLSSKLHDKIEKLVFEDG